MKFPILPPSEDPVYHWRRRRRKASGGWDLGADSPPRAGNFIQRARKGGDEMTKQEMVWLARLSDWLTKEGYTTEEIAALIQYIAFGIKPDKK